VKRATVFLIYELVFGFVGEPEGKGLLSEVSLEWFNLGGVKSTLKSLIHVALSCLH
jgi:hypothetical protein